MKNNYIACDVDDTIADLMTTWLEVFNSDWKENLKREDIVDWDLEKFTHKKGKIYEYLYNINLYYGVQPVKDALKGVQFLHSLGYKVLYITVEDPNNYKYKWLLENGFLFNKQTYIVSPIKTLIDADILIDDNYLGNIVPFYNLNKKAYLFTQPWNKKYDYKYRIDSWQDFMDKVTD